MVCVCRGAGDGAWHAEGCSRHCCEWGGWGGREEFGVGRGQSTKELEAGWVLVIVYEILAHAE